jgi:hypothetical protein
MFFCQGDLQLGTLVLPLRRQGVVRGRHRRTACFLGHPAVSPSALVPTALTTRPMMPVPARP